ncbi:MAG: alpha/beta hydrolase family protein [Planctomycetaceae bacterium]
MRNHNTARLVAVLLCCLGCVSSAAAQDWVSKKSQWKGFERLHFKIDGKDAWLTVPKTVMSGRPWIWRARFPGYHSEADEKLLGEGFHVGYVDIAGLFGSLKAIERADRFYQFVTQKAGLAKKVALEGVSRGGLLVYNWAAKHPNLVACIYCDTPVCDFKSWPAGQGSGIGHAASWKQCLAAYKLDEKAALAYAKNPIDHAAVFAKAKIPLMTIVSDNDRVVPPDENTFVLETRLRELGHSIEILRVAKGTKKSNGHHFTHPDPMRVVAFIKKHTTQKAK